jgi:hypothetical protein
MKRLLLWIVVLVIAAAPVLNDVCRLDCERAHPPECPLHQPAPHKCAHDHSIGAAALTRAGGDATRPMSAAVAVAPYRIAVAPVSINLARVERQHAPPIRSPRPDVLRI